MSKYRPPRLALLLLCAALTACGEPDAPVPGESIVPPTLRTAHPGLRGGLLPEPHIRYPEGTKLVLEGGTNAGPSVVLSEGLVAAGGPTATLDGQGVLFVAKASPDERYGIWGCRPLDAEPKRLHQHDGEIGSVAELPDGRWVYAGSIPGQAVVPGMRRRWALFVRASDGASAEQISFGAGCDVDPVILRDGRVLYVSWEPSGGMYLWTVHPDGTGAARLPGAHGGTPFAILPREGGDGTIYYRLGDDEARAVDPRAPGAPGATRVVPPEIADGVCVVAARRLPQGHLSLVRSDVPYGTVFGLDAAVAHPQARALRFLTFRDETVLGAVDLHPEDGSFFVRVPPNLRLVVELLDEHGAALGRQQTPFWVRPNEVRACIGCHEDRETAPPNRRPRALDDDPVSFLEGGR